jgi:hypothetical protein
MNALTLMLLVTVQSVSQPAKGPDMVLRWNEVALQTIRAERSPPPIAARNLAILHLSIYDAVIAIEGTHRPYLVEASVPIGTSPEAAVASAAHRALSSLYPKQREYFDLVLARCWAELPRSEARAQGEALGRLIADRMVESRRDDGSATIGQYSYKKNIAAWIPTPPGYQAPLLPEWGYVKPFAIQKGTQYRPAAPPELGSPAYAEAFHEVKKFGGKQSKARTDEQTQIAHFWADDLGTVTPPGHWNKIAQSLAQDRNHTLAQNARLFAHLNITLADAGILCWVIKFTFNFWRPVTAIQQADRDDAWMPLLNSPPFPAYVSGHSTFSSAAASLLAQSFGTDNVRFATASDGLPGKLREFTSLTAAAEEAGMSRIYGGIHWRFDNTEGLKVGRTLGEYVYKNTLQPRRQQVLRPSFDEPPVIRAR